MPPVVIEAPQEAGEVGCHAVGILRARRPRIVGILVERARRPRTAATLVGRAPLPPRRSRAPPARPLRPRHPSAPARSVRRTPRADQPPTRLSAPLPSCPRRAPARDALPDTRNHPARSPSSGPFAADAGATANASAPSASSAADPSTSIRVSAFASTSPPRLFSSKGPRGGRAAIHHVRDGLMLYIGTGLQLQRLHRATTVRSAHRHAGSRAIHLVRSARRLIRERRTARHQRARQKRRQRDLPESAHRSSCPSLPPTSSQRKAPPTRRNRQHDRSQQARQPHGQQGGSQRVARGRERFSGRPSRPSTPPASPVPPDASRGTVSAFTHTFVTYEPRGAAVGRSLRFFSKRRSRASRAGSRRLAAGRRAAREVAPVAPQGLPTSRRRTTPSSPRACRPRRAPCIRVRPLPAVGVGRERLHGQRICIAFVLKPHHHRECLARRQRHRLVKLRGHPAGKLLHARTRSHQLAAARVGAVLPPHRGAPPPHTRCRRPSCRTARGQAARRART